MIANVIVWAHHIYIDYPRGSPQAALNTAMQPLTFSVTIVSALSLYSLVLHDLPLALRSGTRPRRRSSSGSSAGCSPGLSGVVNATIAFDQVVHNTLWIVGHFHHMALLEHRAA